MDVRTLAARQRASAEFTTPAAAQLYERASFELNEEDIQALRKHFDSFARLNGAHCPCPRPEAAEHLHEYQQWQAQHPSILSNFDDFAQRARGRQTAIFLDYDGTLTPIVKDPDRAFMSQQMRQTVRAVARLFPTAIISGRGRDKVFSFVQLQELFYAGSHGLDIVGPVVEGVPSLAFQPAAAFGPVMDAVFAQLQQQLAPIPGAFVEHNKFCVSVHYRNCAPEAFGTVAQSVQSAVDAQPQLRVTRGRKVLEIRPKVDWDKGCALKHLLNVLGMGAGSDVVPVYIGDDITDEDAFRVVQGHNHGLGILVSTKAKPTAACHTLRDPAEVMAFLGRLVEWGHSQANCWHSHGSCVGWALNPSPLTPIPTPTQEDPATSSSQVGESSFADQATPASPWGGPQLTPGQAVASTAASKDPSAALDPRDPFPPSSPHPQEPPGVRRGVENGVENGGHRPSCRSGVSGGTGGTSGDPLISPRESTELPASPSGGPQGKAAQQAKALELLGRSSGSSSGLWGPGSLTFPAAEDPLRRGGSPVLKVSGSGAWGRNSASQGIPQEQQGQHARLANGSAKLGEHEGPGVATFASPDSTPPSPSTPLATAAGLECANGEAQQLPNGDSHPAPVRTLGCTSVEPRAL